MIRIIKYFFSEFTYFSQSARRATWVLIVLILLSLAAPTIYSSFTRAQSKTSNLNQTEQFNKIIASLESKPERIYNIPDSSFDPNKLKVTNWENMGLPASTSQRISNYVSKGGKFRKAEDVLKIYGFDSVLFVKLKPLMVFPVATHYPNNKKFKYENKQNKPFDINKADSIALEKLPGIGPILASRIIKYRNLLGGFYCKEQLLEVYGLKPELFEKIEKRIYTDTSNITRININTATYGELKKHPYIGKDKTILILKYKKHNNKIQNINELQNNMIFSGDQLKKLIPYLEL